MRLRRRLGILLMSLALGAGCGSGSSTGTGGASGTGAGGAAGGAGGTGGEAGGGGAGGASGAPLSGTISADQTVSGDVGLIDDATVAPGVTLTLSAGATLHAAQGKKLIVQGTLAAQGTATAPVRFQSQAHSGPGQWQGLVAQNGGQLNLTWAEIHDAQSALALGAGSSYTIDHLLVDYSATMAQINADGTIAHSQFHGLGSSQSGSPMSINEASPHFSDTVIDQGHQYAVDMVLINGASSSPVFDHVEIAQSHCALHFNSATNAVISYSYLHGNSYGMMINGASNTQVEMTNLEQNQTNIGYCGPGDVHVTGSYFDGAAFDGSCSGQQNSAPAQSPLSGVGPRP